MSKQIEILSDNISKLRKSRGLSQKELADSLGISFRSVQNYEYRKREPSLDQLAAFAQYFDVSIDYLVGLSDFKAELASLHWINVKEKLKKGLRGYLYGIPNPSKRAVKLKDALRSFPTTVRTLRKKNKWSIEELSTLTSIPQSVLIHYEDDNLQFMPKRRYFEKLAGVFQVECDMMFGVKTFKNLTLSELLIKGMTLADINEFQLAKLVNVKYKDLSDIINGTFIVTDSLLLFRLMYALPLTIDVFNAAGYSYFDYDCFDLQTGERIEPPSDETELANLIVKDPEALQLFDEYYYASNKDKQLLLEMWRNINRTNK